MPIVLAVCYQGKLLYLCLYFKSSIFCKCWSNHYLLSFSFDKKHTIWQQFLMRQKSPSGSEFPVATGLQFCPGHLGGNAAGQAGREVPSWRGCSDRLPAAPCRPLPTTAKDTAPGCLSGHTLPGWLWVPTTQALLLQWLCLCLPGGGATSASSRLAGAAQTTMAGWQRLAAGRSWGSVTSRDLQHHWGWGRATPLSLRLWVPYPAARGRSPGHTQPWTVC